MCCYLLPANTSEDDVLDSPRRLERQVAASAEHVNTLAAPRRIQRSTIPQRPQRQPASAQHSAPTHHPDSNAQCTPGASAPAQLAAKRPTSAATAAATAAECSRATGPGHPTTPTAKRTGLHTIERIALSADRMALLRAR